MPIHLTVRYVSLSEFVAASLDVPELHSAGSTSHGRRTIADAGGQQRAAVAVRQAALAGGISHLVGAVCGAHLMRHRAVAAELLTARGAAAGDWTGPLVRLGAGLIPCIALNRSRHSPRPHRNLHPAKPGPVSRLFCR